MKNDRDYRPLTNADYDGMVRSALGRTDRQRKAVDSAKAELLLSEKALADVVTKSLRSSLGISEGNVCEVPIVRSPTRMRVTVERVSVRAADGVVFLHARNEDGPVTLESTSLFDVNMSNLRFRRTE